MFSAWGPFWPWVTSNVTFWPSYGLVPDLCGPLDNPADSEHRIGGPTDDGTIREVQRPAARHRPSAA
ncbi:hypothetical protein GCM10023205_82170 [Yinghuangia aomiensis]|uniref:Uncharacterized protein n=1 Tax=Yinghuangia aomiensis TaxID=676205 RepID=A0ABP9IF35_9ACTN